MPERRIFPTVASHPVTEDGPRCARDRRVPPPVDTAMSWELYCSKCEATLSVLRRDALSSETAPSARKGKILLILSKFWQVLDLSDGTSGPSAPGALVC